LAFFKPPLEKPEIELKRAPRPACGAGMFAGGGGGGGGPPAGGGGGGGPPAFGGGGGGAAAFGTAGGGGAAAMGGGAATVLAGAAGAAETLAEVAPAAGAGLLEEEEAVEDASFCLGRTSRYEMKHTKNQNARDRTW